MKLRLRWVIFLAIVLVLAVGAMTFATLSAIQNSVSSWNAEWNYNNHVNPALGLRYDYTINQTFFHGAYVFTPKFETPGPFKLLVTCNSNVFTSPSCKYFLLDVDQEAVLRQLP